jgi:hypothetical protein
MVFAFSDGPTKWLLNDRSIHQGLNLEEVP